MDRKGVKWADLCSDHDRLLDDAMLRCLEGSISGAELLEIFDNAQDGKLRTLLGRRVSAYIERMNKR